MQNDQEKISDKLDNPSGCQHVGRRRARRSRVLLPLAVVYLVSLAAALAAKGE